MRFLFISSLLGRLIPALSFGSINYSSLENKGLDDINPSVDFQLMGGLTGGFNSVA
jgi:hypothetical protein